MKFLAVFDSLSNKTFACSEKKRAYQNRWTIKALCLYYHCVFNFIKVYFINAFHCFWCFLFWVRSLALNNHFPDLWKPLMNPSRFSFQVKNSKKKWKAFNRKQHCDKEKTPPIYEPNEFLKFCFQHGALFKFRVGLHDLFSPFWRSHFT